MNKITFPTSTLNKPLRFFDQFCSRDSIKEAKERFYPNPSDEFDQWRPFPVTIDLESESFEVEYEHEVDWDPYTGPKLEWRKRTYTFRKVLAQELQQEFEQAKYLLEANLDQKPNKLKAKYFIEKVISNQVRNFHLIENTTCFKPYENECKQPLINIIQFIYNEYPAFAPQMTPEIKSILSLVKIHGIGYKTRILMPSIIDDIIKLRDDQNASLFYLSSTPQAKEKLEFYLSGAFHEIKTPLTLPYNLEAANYLISVINQLKGYKATTIQSAKIFKLGQLDFNVNNHYKSISTFTKKMVNPLRDRIDAMISSHLI